MALPRDPYTSRRLDHGTVGDGGVPEDSDNSGADVDAVLLILELLNPSLVSDDAVLADARVLVNDGVGDGAPLANANRNPTLGDNLRLLLVRLIEVSPDDHGTFDGAPPANLRAEADDSVLNSAVRDGAAVRDDGILHVALLNLGRGEEAGRGVDGRAGIIELELGRVLSKREVRLKERLDGSDVLPVIVEEVGLHVVAVGSSLRDDLAAEVIVLGVLSVEERHEGRFLEDVDTHGRNVRVALSLIGGEAEDGGVNLHRLELVALGLLRKLGDATGVVDLHETEVGGALVVHGEAADGDVGVDLAVAVNEGHVVHAVEVIAGEDDDVLHILVLDILEQPRVLTDRVGGSLEPLLATEAGSLRRGKHLDEAVAAVHDTVAEVVSAGKVAVQGYGVELGEYVHLGDTRVKAVGHGHVDKAVRAADGHGGLGTRFGERVQTSSCATAEDNSSDRLGVGDGSGRLVLLGLHGGSPGGGLHRARDARAA